MKTLNQYNERTGHKKTNTVWFQLYELHGIVKFPETESRTVVPRGWGKKNGELAGEDDKTLAMDSSDSWKNDVNVLSAFELYT